MKIVGAVGRELTRDGEGTVVGLEVALQGEVQLSAEAQEEEPTLADGGAPIELDGDIDGHHGLGFFQLSKPTWG